VLALPDPKLIFKTADIFSETAKTMLLKSKVEGKLYLTFAFGVNAALATELYLKCLLLIECGQFPKRHNLKLLFGQLKPGTRQILKRKHDEIVRQDQRLEIFLKHGMTLDLDSLLEKGQDIFEQFRYPYEPNTKEVFFGLTGLIACTREYILSLNPKWIDGESTSQAH
jgi:HEPN domain-containing protein